MMPILKYESTFPKGTKIPRVEVLEDELLNRWKTRGLWTAGILLPLLLATGAFFCGQCASSHTVTAAPAAVTPAPVTVPAPAPASADLQQLRQELLAEIHKAATPAATPAPPSAPAREQVVRIVVERVTPTAAPPPTTPPPPPRCETMSFDDMARCERERWLSGQRR